MLAAAVFLLAALQTAAPPSPPPPGVAPDQRVSAITGKNYRIGPGDILRVTVYGHEDLTQTVVVQPNGRFAFPLIGSVVAGESTPSEVEGRIVAVLSKGLIRNPQVTVVVQEYRSKVVFVVGEVTRPGAYPLTGETSVVEILSRAGPLSANAGSEVVIVRPATQVDRPLLPSDVATGNESGGASAPRAEVLRVNVREIQAGQLEKNLLLRANDTVFVPQATRIFVTGEVRNPGAFPFSAGLTVRQAISLAGGFTEDASSGGARVVRDVSGAMRTIKMKLDERLQAGDTVVVKAKLF